MLLGTTGRPERVAGSILSRFWVLRGSSGQLPGPIWDRFSGHRWCQLDQPYRSASSTSHETARPGLSSLGVSASNDRPARSATTSSSSQLDRQRPASSMWTLTCRTIGTGLHESANIDGANSISHLDQPARPASSTDLAPSIWPDRSQLDETARST